MTQMIRLFAAANTQLSQHLLPTRIVDKIVNTTDEVCAPIEILDSSMIHHRVSDERTGVMAE